MTRLLQIPAHVRRAPLDPYAAIKAAKTEQLRNEVRYRRAVQLALIISIMIYDLEDALMDGLSADPEYRAVL